MFRQLDVHKREKRAGDVQSKQRSSVIKARLRLVQPQVLHRVLTSDAKRLLYSR